MAAYKSLVVLAALSLIPSAQAWYQKLPPCLEPFQPFLQVGCYDNGKPGEPTALSEMFEQSQNMTIERCVSTCKGNNFRYAGLSYYDTCYCGQTVDNPSVDSTQCSFKCAGNQFEVCGGDTGINIYTDTTFLDASDQTIAEYSPLGCYTDNSPDGKTLFYQQADLDTVSMTTEKCLTACKGKAFPFAGTEFSGECYCGVVMGNGTVQADDENCNMKCTGNDAQNCGGAGHINVYVLKDLESLQPCGYTPLQSSSMVSTISGILSTAPVSSSTYSTDVVSSTSSISTTDAMSSTSSTSTTGIVSSTLSTTPFSSPTSTTSTVSSASSTRPASTPTSSEASTVSSASSTAPAPTATTSRTSTMSTTKLPTSSTFSTTSTTNGQPACTSTIITTPPKCEYGCGKWCAQPLPDFKDSKSCLVAYSQCAVQVASCFQSAGFPKAMDCFNFFDWCSEIQKYCSSSSVKSGKSECYKKLPPAQPTYTPKPSTSTSVYPCKATTKAKPTSTKLTSTCNIPQATGICVQPKAYPSAVGGIKLPMLTCNNIESDYNSKGKNVFKLYTDADSASCPSYPRDKCGNACAEACLVQFNQCKTVYAKGCATDGRVDGTLYGQGYSSNGKRRSYFEVAEVAKRTTGRWQKSYDGAVSDCKGQYNACRDANKGVSASGKCGKFGEGY